MIGLKFLRHLFNQSEVKPKPIVSRPCTFSRALCRLRVIRVLIDLLAYLRHFWLAEVITLVLVLRHSFENRSIRSERDRITAKVIFWGDVFVDVAVVDLKVPILVWDRTSACKGASGSPYQSILDLSYPPIQSTYVCERKTDHHRHPLLFANNAWGLKRTTVYSSYPRKLEILTACGARCFGAAFICLQPRNRWPVSSVGIEHVVWEVVSLAGPKQDTCECRVRV